jgi:hypothetical protein
MVRLVPLVSRARHLFPPFAFLETCADVLLSHGKEELSPIAVEEKYR